MAIATSPKRPYAPRLSPQLRREQLLDTAQAIALERGFHAVTIDGVAKATGVTRPVVYGLYADRTELLRGLLERAERRALAQLAPALPEVPGRDAAVEPGALLVAGLTAYLTAVRDDPATWRVLLLPPEGAPAELAERLTAAHREVLRSLRDLVAWGLERIGQPIDVDLMARSVLTLSEGAARLMLQRPADYPIERFRTFTESILGGLVGG